MAYNAISGTILAAKEYTPGDLIVGNIVSGNLGASDGSSIINIPRVSNAANNAVITNVGGDANNFTCESNLTFDGDTLAITGELTASTGVSASFFMGDGSRLTGITSGDGGGGSFTHYSGSRGTNTVLVATASVAWAGDLGTSHSASQVGSDVYFFVSGALGAKDSSDPAIAVFGGDVHMSGNLSTDNEISSSGNISASVFYGDGSKLTGISAGGDGGIFTQPNGTQAYTTSSINVGSAVAPTHTLTVVGTSLLSGNTDVDGHLIPSIGDTYDLGSSAKPWRNLYVSSSTIYFGSDALSVSDDNLKFGSGSTTKGFDVGFMNFKNNGIWMDPGRLFKLRAYQIQMFGGIGYVRKVVADDYTIKDQDYLVGIQSDTLTSSITLTLPAATNLLNGQTFVIKDEGGAAHTYPVTIACAGDDVVDGTNQVVLESPYASIQIYCNGIGKYFIC